jgi:signal transduction histidine kinase
MRTIQFIRSSSFIVGALFSVLLALGILVISTLIGQIEQIPGLEQQHIQQVTEHVTFFSTLIIALMICIVLLSFIIAFYVVNRINRMSDTITTIMNTGNLSSRMEIDSSWDDLSKLSEVINRMLAALEEMVAGVKSVSDNIAHDLRTPLTRLRGDLEMSGDLAQGDDKHQLIAEVDNILSIFNGLLRIADIETEKQKSAFKHNQISEIATDVMDLYEALADEKQVQISATIEPCQMYSDRDLLFQAFANVLDNAIKFTPEAGKISVLLHSLPDGSICFSVCDSGPGIPAEHVEQVTKRFYRVESSRTSKGNGLGLALVNAVVRLHGGQLSLSSALEANSNSEETPGLCCKMQFNSHKTSN